MARPLAATHDCRNQLIRAADLSPLPHATVSLSRVLLRAGSGAASPQRRPTDLFELRRGDGAPTAGETRAVPRVAGRGVRLDLDVTTGLLRPPAPPRARCRRPLHDDEPKPTSRANRLERRFAMIWKFRLITLIPVIMSLLGSISASCRNLCRAERSEQVLEANSPVPTAHC